MQLYPPLQEQLHQSLPIPLLCLSELENVPATPLLRLQTAHDSSHRTYGLTTGCNNVRQADLLHPISSCGAPPKIPDMTQIGHRQRTSPDQFTPVCSSQNCSPPSHAPRR
eukprot:4376781-Ditylum_brightwellii.AAC.2